MSEFYTLIKKMITNMCLLPKKKYMFTLLKHFH